MLPDIASLALKAVVKVMGERSPITYRRGSDVQEIGGVYQASHVGLDPESGIQVRSTQPVLLINGAELTIEPKQGDEVEVRGGMFRVRDAQPDGHSGWLLMLHRLPATAETIGMIYGNTVIRANTMLTAGT
jgi:hypothetical protein